MNQESRIKNEKVSKIIPSGGVVLEATLSRQVFREGGILPQREFQVLQAGNNEPGCNFTEP